MHNSTPALTYFHKLLFLILIKNEEYSKEVSEMLNLWKQVCF